jgi:hypothetical protein
VADIPKHHYACQAFQQRRAALELLKFYHICQLSNSVRSPSPGVDASLVEWFLPRSRWGAASLPGCRSGSSSSLLT